MNNKKTVIEPSQEQTSSSKTSSSKRNLNKVLFFSTAALALAPKVWVKPVIDTVVMPAHAQTSTVSPGSCNDAFTSNGTFVVPANVRSISVVL